DLVGLSTFRVRATNIIDSGLISGDTSGLIDIAGDQVNLNNAQFDMGFAGGFGGGNFGATLLDWGSGLNGATNHTTWDPFDDLTPTNALSDLFSSSAFPGLTNLQMSLNNVTVYFDNLAPTTNAAGIIIWRGVWLQDNSPASVVKNVYFDPLTP